MPANNTDNVSHHSIPSARQLKSQKHNTTHIPQAETAEWRGMKREEGGQEPLVLTMGWVPILAQQRLRTATEQRPRTSLKVYIEIFVTKLLSPSRERSNAHQATSYANIDNMI